MAHSTYRTQMYTVFAALAALGISACGSSGSSGSTTSSDGVSTLSDLPLASSPVVSSSSTSLSSKGLKAVTKALASTGIKLKTMNNSSFSTTSSLAMCEHANMLKQAINEAVQGDTILCYIKQMDDEFAAISGLNIYDGNPHVFKLDFGGGDNDFRVKLQITKDSAGSISDFKMWACEGATQSEHLHQSISGSNFTMTSKYIDGSGAETFSGSTSVTGTLNSSNQFTAKTITNLNSFAETNGVGYGARTVVQGAENATISGWDKGTWSWSGGSGGYARNFCSDAELLNSSLISTIAVGSGAAKGTVSGSYDGGTYSDTFLQGWNGDTTLPESNSFLTSLSCTPPELASETAIAFSGDEVFDCDISSATTLTVNDAEVMAACSDLSLGWDWVNCWDTIESE